MIVTEESVVIDRPIDEVFTFFADPAIVTLFMTNVITYEVVSGTAGEVGSVVQGVVKVAGRRLELTEELTGVEHGKYLR
ncbi:SRPBCC family protein, partial [Rhodococcus koreensis]